MRTWPPSSPLRPLRFRPRRPSTPLVPWPRTSPRSAVGTFATGSPGARASGVKRPRHLPLLPLARRPTGWPSGESAMKSWTRDCTSTQMRAVSGRAPWLDALWGGATVHVLRTARSSRAVGRRHRPGRFRRSGPRRRHSMISIVKRERLPLVLLTRPAPPPACGRWHAGDLRPFLGGPSSRYRASRSGASKPWDARVARDCGH